MRTAAPLVAVLPLGATEQHGPHLPVDTDWMIAEALAGRLAAAALYDRPALRVLPVERVGWSPEHLGYAGTRSLEVGEAIGRWTAIGAALAGEGVRRLLLLNAHGGNAPLLTIVATELRRRHAMLCVVTHWSRFGVPDGLFPPDEVAFGIHAGAVETSIMLALRPDLVRQEALADFPSLQRELVERGGLLRAYGPHAFGWMIEDLNPAGAVGDARLASAEAGEAILARATAGLLDLCREMVAFDTGRFAPAR